jgi:molecular chaperone DnaJ
VNKKLEVSVPAGIDTAQRIILRGQGSAGRNGGANGDLIIEVRVTPHNVFEREGNNIYCEIPISFAEATLGAEIDVPILGGKTEKYTIPEGTQSGTVFTLRGKGIPDVNTKRRGDLIITVNVETPKNLTQEQKKLLTDFANSLGEVNTGKRQSFFKKLFK